jgi:hypothetical protein
MGKNSIIVIIITSIIMSVLLIGYNIDQKNQLKIRNVKLSMTNLSENVEYNIDSIDYTGGLGTINGWAVELGVNTIDVKPSIILRSENGSLYMIKTRIVQRKDVTQMYLNKNKNNSDENQSYDNCGFVANFKVSDLKKNERYQIGIQIQIGKSKYFTWTDKYVQI